ncbi:MAG: permease [Euryarchaeota archaeon]|nr:permease [Euryarchaeota archaeon]
MVDLFSALGSGWDSLLSYLGEHVLTCLVPAFFIAGAIAVFVKKDSILKYFGPKTKRSISYPVAAVSGTVLAVCSCTILPLFAGIYKKGSGIGPATTFLFAGPAINVLAIVYTAQVLGYDLGLARGVSAILLSVVIGIIMSLVFKDEIDPNSKGIVTGMDDTSHDGRPGWVVPTFFVLMVGILIFGSAKIDILLKMAIVLPLIVAVALLVAKMFEKDEITDWGAETWDLTKKIFPILVIGAFAVGVIAYFIPAETFRPYLGDNTISANLLASVIGALLYMPTLLEVPIIGTTFGYSVGAMAEGPALTLLLTGPSMSLPSMVVLYRIMGARKTIVYILLVVCLSTMAGLIYGSIAG